ncbi:hypothetical protein [Thalassotalea eurytherma]|nr:hypothetical protein [Thalassotalea eurytherma]
MMKIISFIITLLCSFSALSSGCEIEINSKASIKCLERKIDSLEQQLKDNKQRNLKLPTGAVVNFKGGKCPNGWLPYQPPAGIVNVRVNQDMIMCEKI